MPAWDDRGSEFAHRDLMNVNSDVLFADPLGIRGGGGPGVGAPRKQAGGSSPSTSPGPGGGGYGRGVATPTASPAMAEAGPYQHYGRPQTDVALASEEDGGWLRYAGELALGLLAGGRQCCSMRDRSRAEDVEAAKRASQLGRPPQAQAQARANGAVSSEEPGGSAFPGPLGAGGEDASPAVRAPAAAAAVAGATSAAKRRPASPDAPEDRVPGGSAQRRGVPQGLSLPDVAATASTASGTSAAAAAAAQAPPVQAPGTRMPHRWEWPPWCLNFKEPSIEVYVVDEDTGQGRWCEGEPQSRVVDGSRKDAFLCVEYEWDGDYYVEDFGPERIRRRGAEQTVYQLYSKPAEGASGNSAGARAAAGGGRPPQAPGRPGEPASSAAAAARRRDDTGRGVSAFLDDSR
eukprot:TRINITY_DN15695_c0_g3_i1.p1 TRINITY_DN15695_c0_g3~~TRINITY_DN15695_c0_g3_i1.p1  ORF type:complete len:435 (+),score=93.90 TRINITY_DN15695_c0_g3_i1:94-1305(+)